MGTQGRSQHSHTFDVSTLLEDGVAITTARAGQVATVARVMDFGFTGPGTVQRQAYTSAKLVVDVRAFDFTTGDETAQIIWQLSDDADADGGGFDAGDLVVNKVVIPWGDVGGIASSTSDDISGTGRVVVGVDNEHLGTVMRFGRLFVVVAGTTPSITVFAYLTDMTVS